MMNPSPTVLNALQRLQSILPLEANLNELTSEAVQLYRDILSHFDQYGSLHNLSLEQHDQELRQLVKYGFIVMDNTEQISGAYPFTSEQRIHRIEHHDVTVHCMCALDALSVSPMFDHPCEVISACHVTDQSIHIIQDGLNVLNPEENNEVFFGIEWSAACSSTSCADSLCGEMLFLKGNQTTENWQADQPESREVFDLNDAIQFGAAFFRPLNNKPVELA